MKYYYSAPSNMYKALMNNNINTYLLSFANDKKDVERYINCDVLIDSGAFSVWNSGKTIDINEYLSFIQTLPKNWSFVNLDVIVDSTMSKKQINDSIEKGYQNFLYLSSKQPNILPVHHYGENLDVLKRYLNHTDHICLSPTKGLRTNDVDKYFKECFSIIDGKKVKVHALGMTIPSLMFKYPFYSVDSITYKKSKIGSMNKMYWAVADFYSLVYKEIRYWKHITNQATEIWKMREITWE